MTSHFLPPLLLLFFFVKSVQSCSCIMGNAAATFNHSDWVSLVCVMRATIDTSKCGPVVLDPSACDSNHYEIIYTVRHLDVYKKPPTIRHLSTQIHTAGNSGLCGVDFLTRWQRIVLAGTLDHSVLRIFSCTYANINQTEAEQLRTNF